MKRIILIIALCLLLTGCMSQTRPYNTELEISIDEVEQLLLREGSSCPVQSVTICNDDVCEVYVDVAYYLVDSRLFSSMKLVSLQFYDGTIKTYKGNHVEIEQNCPSE